MAKKEPENWIGNIDVGRCGNGHFVRIDGCDVFEDLNEFGCKTRRSLSIAERLPSAEAAQAKAVEWLKNQLKRLGT